MFLLRVRSSFRLCVRTLPRAVTGGRSAWSTANWHLSPIRSCRLGRVGRMREAAVTEGLCLQDVEVFTDGACRGNPGPGGWAALLRMGGHEKLINGAEEHTTNNRMELMAAIRGLEALTRPCRVVLTTDSQYVRQGITGWLNRWKANGWRTSQKKPVKNQDLWQRLDQAVAAHEISWHWVKGHSGHTENERVDQAANDAIDEMSM